jgi:hypothetical protein
MSAALTDIREALAAVIADAYGGLRQVSPYFLSSPNPPTIDIFPDDVTYHGASQNGAETWMLIVRVIVDLNSDKGAQIQLDKMLASSGADSLKEAIEGTEPSQTLGGLVSDVTVMRAGSYGPYEISSTQRDALGAQLTVRVLI